MMGDSRVFSGLVCPPRTKFLRFSLSPGRCTARSARRGRRASRTARSSSRRWRRGRPRSTGVLDSQDTQVMAESLRRLGVNVTQDLTAKTAVIEGLGGGPKVSAGRSVAREQRDQHPVPHGPVHARSGPVSSRWQCPDAGTADRAARRGADVVRREDSVRARGRLSAARRGSEGLVGEASHCLRQPLEPVSERAADGRSGLRSRRRSRRRGPARVASLHRHDARHDAAVRRSGG